MEAGEVSFPIFYSLPQPAQPVLTCTGYFSGVTADGSIRTFR